MDASYKKAEQILTENMAKLHLVADYLMKEETMEGDQFEAIMQSSEAADMKAPNVDTEQELGNEQTAD